MPDVLLARAFIEGLTEEAFEADLLRFYAVTRCLEIISEASRRLPSAIRDRHPELPWRAITRVRGPRAHAAGSDTGKAADFLDSCPGGC